MATRPDVRPRPTPQPRRRPTSVGSTRRRRRHETPIRAATPVFTARGGDWDDLIDEATSLHEERIVVNMGPQHPSTHGVLRLILELDGETVTEARAGIGYLHTGIEKNMEYRTWTQGVTFCTRMDYLTPMFQETAYCLAIEKLLGVTDEVPERASIIRVLHDGAQPGRPRTWSPRHRRHGARRHDGHDDRLPRARAGPAGHRDGHRAADEQRLRPARRGRPGRAARRHRQDPRGRPGDPQGHPRARAAAQREPDRPGPPRRGRVSRPHRLHRPGHDRPGPAVGRPAARPAQGRPLLWLRELRLRRRRPATRATPTGGCGCASTRCTSRCASSSSAPTGCSAAPVSRS